MQDIKINQYRVRCEYDSHIERFLPDGSNTHYVEGYSCEVFDVSDTQFVDPVDYFCLGVGHEISDLSPEELEKGLHSHFALCGMLADAVKTAPAETVPSFDRGALLQRIKGIISAKE